MRRTLIVVDMQNDFISGPLGTKETQAIVPNVKRKIEEYKNRGNRIIFTRDTHYNNYLETNEGKHLPVEHCIVGTDGWKIHEELEDKKCLHINKKSFGFHYWDEWIEPEDTESIELVGVCTSICVISNALILKAIFRETEITVDASCCACVTPESHQNALEVMKLCQINVIGE
jgi:nicotinamidase-related amidase